MNKDIKKCVTDPLFRGIFFLFCLFLLAGVVFHFSLYTPSVSAKEALNRQLADVSSRYFYQQKLSSELEKVADVQVRLKELNSMLKRPFNSVAFSTDMAHFVSESGVEVLAQSYSPPRRRENFTVVEINVRVSSDYKAVRKFVSLLKSGQFFVVVDRARLELRDSSVLGDLDLQVRYLGDDNEL